MISLTQQKFFSAAVRVMTLALFLVTLGASVALAQLKAYVANDNDNTVAVVDPATNTVIKTIAVGTFPAQIAVTPNGATAYVANKFTESITVIDTATDTVRTTLLGIPAATMAITPNGAFLYVACVNGVVVFDTATNAVITTVTLPPRLLWPVWDSYHS